LKLALKEGSVYIAHRFVSVADIPALKANPNVEVLKD
jgi:hypothetical protein